MVWSVFIVYIVMAMTQKDDIVILVGQQFKPLYFTMRCG